MQKLTPDDTLLGLLAANSQHGYQLLDAFRDPQQLGQVWYVSTSQLYAVLKRLEQQGLIAGTQIACADAPTRTEYALTEAGRARLSAWLDEPQPSPSLRRIRVEFLSRLYIAGLLGIPAEPIIARQRAACTRRLEGLRARRVTPPHGVGDLALEMVIAQLEAIIAWLGACDTVLDSPGAS
ncbi:MAG: PadR family transcriptional regulator [Anaerolineae bacterium]|nr:PadR family transcriptional regulator [Anaerolineae bacterium]MCZ7540540.1 PadR family transcriptional regulator [Anaerolineae bacterium]